jgi:hypothetical protein
MVSEKRDRERRIHWPYCIEQLESGRYVLLNRRYKPLGTASLKFIADFGPWSIELALTEAEARRLSWNASDDVSRVYFYKDRTVPTRSRQNMEAYERRLALLASIGGPDITHLTGRGA